MMNLLEVSNLTKRFGENEVLRGISFSVREGSCTALLGPNGAGKTTTLTILAGLIKQTAGEIRFEGKTGADYRKSIGYLPQYPAMYEWMSGFEFLVYSAQLCQLPKALAKERAAHMLESLGLKDARKKKIGAYSGGMRQRLGLAQAMIHHPKLLILDEPVSALDPIGRYEVLNMIRELKGKTTILFSTHILHDAEEVCDDITIIAKGENRYSGSLDSLRSVHKQTTITIDVGMGTEELIKRMKADAGIQSYEKVNGSAYRLAVSDQYQSSGLLLKEIVNKNMDLKLFETGNISLEELFIKMVTDDEAMVDTL